MIEVHKTYKVTLTEDQLRYLYLILDSKDVSGTVINPFYHKLKEISVEQSIGWMKASTFRSYI